MASKPAILLVKPRGKPIKRLPENAQLTLSSSTSGLYESIAAQSGFSVHRLRVTKGSDGSLVPNSKSVSVESTGLRNQSTVYVKDLGPQIAWRTVFIVEYLGPILIHPLLYYLQPYIYNTNAKVVPTYLQTVSCILVMVHFIKRELETLFVHRFSAATMPAFNIFKNSAHYWLLSGLNIALWTYMPNSPTAQYPNYAWVFTGITLYVIGELGNLSSHLTLRGLRSSGGAERGIPQGTFFNLVTCPNYMFETLSWIGVWIVNRSLSTGVFLLVAAVQMALWAKKKEYRLRKDFPDKYKKKRYVMLPGIY